MKKTFISLVGAAAIAGWASIAGAQCAEVCDETTTLTCDGSAVVTETTHEVVSCTSASDDPAGAVPTGPETCGQVCVDGVVLIGGYASFGVPEGCISVAGAVDTSQQTGGDCVENAVGACENNGCVDRASGSGPCDGSVHERNTTTIDNRDADGDGEPDCA